MAYLWALDCGDVGTAAGYLARALEASRSLGHTLRRDYLLEAAFFEGLYRKDPGVARTYYDQAASSGGWPIEPHMEWRAEAAVLLAEGKCEGALEAAEKGLAAVRRALNEGVAEAQRDWLEQIAGQARACLAPPGIVDGQ